MSDRAAHAAQLREVKQRRLDVLELQAGEQGSATPPHVLTEIEQLRTDLAAFTTNSISSSRRWPVWSFG
jgi:hypothetical protein